MKRMTLIVSGKVQQSGYRDKVVEINRNLGLKGFVENLPDGRVKIVAEGDQKLLVKMADNVRIKNALIRVDDIECSYSDASGDFSGFYKHVIDGETDERLDTAANLLKELIVATNKGFSKINDTLTSGFNISADKQDKMLDNQDKMLDNQNKMLDNQDKMLDKQDKMLDNQDKMLEKQDLQMEIISNGFKDVKDEMKAGFHEVKGELRDFKNEIHMQRDDFKEVFMKEVSELHNEINEMKATLARMQAA